MNLGSKYISQLLNRFNGSIILALAAYNAGPGNAERWRKETPTNLPLEEFIEHIGFKETREYVQNILRNYYWYTKRVRGEVYSNLSSLAIAVMPKATTSTASSSATPVAVKKASLTTATEQPSDAAEPSVSGDSEAN